jgi:putative membrane protein
MMTGYAIPTPVSASAPTPAPIPLLQTHSGAGETSITCSGEFSITTSSTMTSDIGLGSVIAEERSCTVSIPFTITLSEEVADRYGMSDSLAGISEVTASAEAHWTAEVIGEGSLQPSSWQDAATAEARVFGVYKDGEVRLGFYSDLTGEAQPFSAEFRYLNGDGKQHVVSYNTFAPFMEIKYAIENASFGFVEQTALVSEKDMASALSNSKMKFDPAVPSGEVTFSGELPEFEAGWWRFSNLRYTGTLTVDEVSKPSEETLEISKDEWGEPSEETTEVYILGEAWIKRGTGEWERYKAGTPVREGDWIRTGEYSWARVKFPDDIWWIGIEPSTEIQLTTSPVMPDVQLHTAVVREIIGEVWIKEGKTGEWEPCLPGTDLTKYTQFRVGDNGQVRLELLDGSPVALGPRFEGYLDWDYIYGGDQSFYVKYGKAFFRLITGLLGLGPKGGIATISTYGGIRSTEFTVEVDEDDATTFTVLEGVVEVQDIISKAMVALNANQRLTIPKTAEGLNERELLQRIATIDPASIDRWWEEGLTSTQVTTPSSAMTQSVGGPVILIVVVLVVILLVIALILVLFFLLRRRRARRSVKEKSSGWLETLKIRLAKGEITQEEYEELKKRLEET